MEVYHNGLLIAVLEMVPSLLEKHNGTMGSVKQKHSTYCSSELFFNPNI